MKYKRKLLLILLLAVAVIVGILLFASLVRVFMEQPDGEASPIMFSENIYVILVFALLLPIFLIAMIKHIIKTHTSFFDSMREQQITVPKARRAPKVSIDRPAPLEFTTSYSGLGSPAPYGEEHEEDEGEETPRFYMLDKTDREMARMEQPAFNNAVSLEDICVRFRNFAASKLRLYYSMDDIRRFVAGLSVTHIVIMQGMSGTGKTSLAYAFGEFLGNSSVIVPIQPMWKERTDLIGYYNEFTRRFNETLLLTKMYEANYSKDIYVTVLDEMNIARVEYYFAEFLSLLELPNPEERYLDVVSDKWENDPIQLKDGRIKLPTNMWFIGTANNDDSTFLISDKVYDRAMILDLDQKTERFIAPPTERMIISAEEFDRLVASAQKEYEISYRNRKRLEAFDEYLIAHFHVTFGNRIMKQILTYIPVYIACGGDELFALDDILSKKVIRKLESQNPIYFKNAADGLIAYIDDLFGADNMTQCKEHIKRILRNA